MKSQRFASPDSIQRGPVLVLVAVTLLACGEDPPLAPPPSPAPREQVEVDQLAPGELPEGVETAFGLPFPEGFRIESRSKTQMSAIGNSSLEEVANYLRKRLEARDIATGPGQTIFQDARVKEPRGGDAARFDAGADAEEKLRVAVSLRGVRTRVVVSQSIARKAPTGLSEDQRWERLGVRKDGKPADPKKFE